MAVCTVCSPLPHVSCDRFPSDPGHINNVWDSSSSCASCASLGKNPRREDEGESPVGDLSSRWTPSRKEEWRGRVSPVALPPRMDQMNQQVSENSIWECQSPDISRIDGAIGEHRVQEVHSRRFGSQFDSPRAPSAPPRSFGVPSVLVGVRRDRGQRPTTSRHVPHPSPEAFTDYVVPRSTSAREDWIPCPDVEVRFQNLNEALSFVGVLRLGREGRCATSAEDSFIENGRIPNLWFDDQDRKAESYRFHGAEDRRSWNPFDEDRRRVERCRLFPTTPNRCPPAWQGIPRSDDNHPFMPEVGDYCRDRAWQRCPGGREEQELEQEHGGGTDLVGESRSFPQRLRPSRRHSQRLNSHPLHGIALAEDDEGLSGRAHARIRDTNGHTLLLKSSIPCSNISPIHSPRSNSYSRLKQPTTNLRYLRYLRHLQHLRTPDKKLPSPDGDNEFFDEYFDVWSAYDRYCEDRFRQLGCQSPHSIEYERNAYRDTGEPEGDNIDTKAKRSVNIWDDSKAAPAQVVESWAQDPRAETNGEDLYRRSASRPTWRMEMETRGNITAARTGNSVWTPKEHTPETAAYRKEPRTKFGNDSGVLRRNSADNAFERVPDMVSSVLPEPMHDIVLGEIPSIDPEMVPRILLETASGVDPRTVLAKVPRSNATTALGNIPTRAVPGPARSKVSRHTARTRGTSRDDLGCVPDIARRASRLGPQSRRAMGEQRKNGSNRSNEATDEFLDVLEEVRLKEQDDHHNAVALSDRETTNCDGAVSPVAGESYWPGAVGKSLQRAEVRGHERRARARENQRGVDGSGHVDQDTRAELARRLIAMALAL